MGNRNLIKDYELLKSEKPVAKEDIFINSFLLANIEWDMDNILSCKRYTLKAINNLVITSETFFILFRLSVLVGVFYELLDVVSDEVLSLDSSNILNDAFIRYYKAKKDNSDFCIRDISNCFHHGEDRSIILFLLSTFVKDNKVSFLEASHLECPSNISTIRELYLSNYNLDLKALNTLFNYDSSLFYNKDTLWNMEKDNYNFSLLPLGGGDSIGASSYILNLDGYKVIVDCGVKFTEDKHLYPPFEDYIEEILSTELCIITHAHLDHCGAILKLFSLNTSMRFIMTKETKELLKINISSFKSDIESEYLIEDLFKRTLLLDYNAPFCWRKSNLTIELFKAGHILGAASILLKTDNLKVFVTGDYCIEDQMTVEGLNIKNGEKVDILITENTYGNRKNEEKPSKKILGEKFKSYIIQEIEKGKNILIPAFAIGRSQELISYLKDISREYNFRVYVDGASIKVSEAYRKLGYDIKDKNIHYVDDSLYTSKEDFINEEFINNRSCVITSSGMVNEGSAAAVYAKILLSSNKATCILTGYQSDSSLGAKLRDQFKLDSKRYIQIDNETININCSFNEFHITAHCSNTEIMSLVKKIKPTKVILVHGENAKEKREIQRILEKNPYIEVIQSKDNELIKF